LVTFIASLFFSYYCLIFYHNIVAANFQQRRLWGAQNSTLPPNFPKKFRGFRIFKRTLSDKKKYSNNFPTAQNWGEGIAPFSPPSPCHDSTGRMAYNYFGDSGSVDRVKVLLLLP